MSKSIKLYYKTCREQAGLTQEQAIVLLNISNAETLSRYENGHTPVSQDLVASMVKVYRTPLLANWHVRYVNPDLAQYLPEIENPITDGDAAFQMEYVEDDIRIVREAVKAIFRDGVVTAEEAVRLKVKASMLRGIANKALSAAIYLEKREACGNV
ncbi:MAG: helix-turn-helix transcriptional regulator [Oscillospiraceae bacterium]|nr:helix-turn-helix transcriptional regulator [Oscillospiraceae bacterium]